MFPRKRLRASTLPGGGVVVCVGCVVPVDRERPISGAESGMRTCVKSRRQGMQEELSRQTNRAVSAAAEREAIVRIAVPGRSRHGGR